MREILYPRPIRGEPGELLGQGWVWPPVLLRLDSPLHVQKLTIGKHPFVIIETVIESRTRKNPAGSTAAIWMHSTKCPKSIHNRNQHVPIGLARQECDNLIQCPF